MCEGGCAVRRCQIGQPAGGGVVSKAAGVRGCVGDAGQAAVCIIAHLGSPSVWHIHPGKQVIAVTERIGAPITIHHVLKDEIRGELEDVVRIVEVSGIAISIEVLGEQGLSRSRAKDVGAGVAVDAADLAIKVLAAVRVNEAKTEPPIDIVAPVGHPDSGLASGIDMVIHPVHRHQAQAGAHLDRAARTEVTLPPAACVQRCGPGAEEPCNVR